MLRQNAYPRESLAAASFRPDDGRPSLRQSAARVARAIARLIVAPFALLAAALAGVLFVILLPVCGIASLAEGAAKACWSFVRSAFRPRLARGAR